MGRLAYILMCVEAYLVTIYKERNWKPLAKAFWLFPSMCISEWLFFYGQVIPDTVLHDGGYDQLIPFYLTPDEYQILVQQYYGITDGNPDDPNDELCTILNIPFDLIYEYDCVTSDGNPEHKKWAFDASVGLTNKIENILSNHHIALPDIHKLDFLAMKDNDIWGPHFDGEPLSIILNKE